MRDGLLAWQTSKDVGIEVKFGEVEMEQCPFTWKFADLLMIVCLN